MPNNSSREFLFDENDERYQETLEALNNLRERLNADELIEPVEPGPSPQEWNFNDFIPQGEYPPLSPTDVLPLTPEQIELRDRLLNISIPDSPSLHSIDEVRERLGLPTTGRNQSEPIGSANSWSFSNCNPEWRVSSNDVTGNNDYPPPPDPNRYSYIQPRPMFRGGRLRNSGGTVYRDHSGDDHVPAPIGRVDCAPYINAYSSNTTAITPSTRLNLSWDVNYYPEGNEMPRLAVQPTLVERLKIDLDDRKREVRQQVDSAITQMDRALNSLREAAGYLREEEITTTTIEDCKYIVRGVRENLSRAARSINPAPAIFTNMVRQSRNLAAETTRIMNERSEAQREERELAFAEAVAASTEYVPAVEDYVMVQSISSLPCRIVQVVPSSGTPSSLEHASVLFSEQGGMSYERSLGWMRLNGLAKATDEELQMLPQFYTPREGDVIELPNGITGNDPTDITVFTVNHVTPETTVFDGDGRPNPNIRLTSAAAPDSSWTRRVARLRSIGMRPTDREDVAPPPAPEVSADAPLEAGDTFRCTRAMQVIDNLLNSDTVFEVTGTSESTYGRDREVRFRVQNGTGYQFERTVPELGAAGLVIHQRVVNNTWIPVIGNIIQFNGSMRYHVTNVDWNGTARNPMVSFYAENDRRSPGRYEYRYPISELRTLGMRLAN